MSYGMGVYNFVVISIIYTLLFVNYWSSQKPLCVFYFCRVSSVIFQKYDTSLYSLQVRSILKFLTFALWLVTKIDYILRLYSDHGSNLMVLLALNGDIFRMIVVYSSFLSHLLLVGTLLLIFTKKEKSLAIAGISSSTLISMFY